MAFSSTTAFNAVTVTAVWKCLSWLALVALVPTQADTLASSWPWLCDAVIEHHARLRQAGDSRNVIGFQSIVGNFTSARIHDKLHNNSCGEASPAAAVSIRGSEIWVYTPVPPRDATSIGLTYEVPKGRFWAQFTYRSVFSRGLLEHPLIWNKKFHLEKKFHLRLDAYIFIRSLKPYWFSCMTSLLSDLTSAECSSRGSIECMHCSYVATVMIRANKSSNISRRRR